MLEESTDRARQLDIDSHIESMEKLKRTEQKAVDEWMIKQQRDIDKILQKHADEVKNIDMNLESSPHANGLDSNINWEESLSGHIRNVLQDKNDLTTLSKDLEKILLQEALKASKGRRIDAAKILGLGRNTITRKIKDLDL